MTMRKTIAVIIRLAERRAIANYAIAGAVAALNYIQPFLTEDLDILISTDGFEKHRSGLLLLGPIEKALAEMGYTERTDLGYEIDNMEGLSVHRAAGGEIVLTLVSDDNFSVVQRTLLLQFTLAEP